MTEKLLVTWSGGKDCAMVLYELLNDRKYNKKYSVEALLTTITVDYNRISMHGVRTELLERQAEALGLGIYKVGLHKGITNDEYESKMKAIMEQFFSKGVRTVAFGDIFLKEVREYRERNLKKVNMNGLFPLWGKNTHDLAHEFISSGFKAVITCVDSKMLDGRFAGRDYDLELLSEIPPDVDPCGENGEFHTFVFAGPIFKKEINIRKGELVLREDRFYYCDIVSG